ncbi:multidrug DMT transporter permease [Burkholderia multivorans]|uniref:EamA family transporter n=1 Tax=Burkholderia multivorans TaxID=87883 RepID=UPI000DAC3952|nr:EamA family transporter [Burkholderia multivorans]MBR7900735.1 EamA family transporter [Burkholderia multivorans]MBR8048222.1 EamA family transporter [Burkholderia multivorans]RAA26722.1 multidrug DMT transporter permease [Burkholderia multivorans]RAA30295.1 multidrug DMT transporter permease [Burkholderia multivorans]RAA36396.1 multidrug DMT transporter permease [Burkholderia multivorans]
MTPLDRLLDFLARFPLRIRLPQSRGGRVALALVFIYFVWGSTYSGLHFALQSFPPLLLSGLRNLLGGIGLFVFALRRKPEWPTLVEIRNAAIVGTMLVALSSGTIALGMRTVSSGSAAVMVATVPLFATVIAAVAGRRVTKGEWAAVALGMVGIVVLNSGGAAAENSALGTISVLAGALFWAGGAHLATRLKLPSDLFLSTSLQIGLGGLMSTLAAWLLGEHVEHLAVAPVFAFVYLMVFCTMAAYVAYGYLIRHTSPIIASSCMYVNPIVAVALGALMLGEPVTMATVVATVAILGSVGLSFLFDPARQPAAAAAGSPVAATASASVSAADGASAYEAIAVPVPTAMPDVAPGMTAAAVSAASAVANAAPDGAAVAGAGVVDAAAAGAAAAHEGVVDAAGADAAAAAEAVVDASAVDAAVIREAVVGAAATYAAAAGAAAVNAAPAGTAAVDAAAPHAATPDTLSPLAPRPARESSPQRADA